MAQGKGRFFTSVQNLRFVAFEVGNVLFGLDIDVVKEAVVCQGLLRRDWLPDLVDGYAKVRGLSIPVFDLRRIFGFKVEFNSGTRLLLSSFEGRIAGLVVDAITDVELAGSDSDQAHLLLSDEEERAQWLRYVSRVYDSPEYGKIHIIDPSKLIEQIDSGFLQSMLPKDPCA
ncbi:MAG: chemotaxis protein CheW [Nitrospirota bacterium]|nr:chemotaxis protein CheW [Nitrospirota bacterium]